MIGETVSHYRVLERLGQGGMGDVYLAEDLRLQRRVALKTIRAEGHAAEEASDRLLREARAASALNHPNIAVVYEVAEADRPEGTLRFIAMEYVPGETLGVAARRDGVSLDQVIDWVSQVAEALAEAHARGVVHRDLKPSNVMVTAGGRVKVLDFGLAKRGAFPGSVDSTWSRDRPEAPAGLVGTLAYMAPEQALGDPIDGRADVFSLGAVLYELLAGAPPFRGRNAPQVLAAVLGHEPPPVVPRFQDARAANVEVLARRMLSKSAADRPTRMEDVASELHSIRRGLAAPGEPPAPPRTIAVLSFSNITHNGEDDWLGTGIAETVTADLRGIEGLTVIARERVHEALKRLGGGDGGEEGLAVRVGRELGARWVLSGGLQRAGGTIRLTARLVEVASATVVDTVKIDGGMDEIFALQDRIVRELGSSLCTTPAPAPAPRAPDETQVVQAYEAFSRGVINVRLESYEALDRAAFLFERAVALDPTYARAHLELGSAYSAKGDYLALPELYERALVSLRRAIELSPRLPRAWREMGAVLVSLGREDEGIEAIQRALDLDPDDAGALGSLGRAHFIGRAQFREAAACFDRALTRNPEGGWSALQLAHCAALLREFERGEAAARRAVVLQEASLSGQERVVIVGAYMRLGHLAALQGRHAEAIDHFRRELAFQQSVDHALRGRISIELHMRIGASLQRKGEMAAARDSLETARAAFESRLRMGADDPFTRYYAACVSALRGEVEEAVASLERAASMRPRFTIARARIEPELDALRDNPRFRALLG